MVKERNFGLDLLRAIAITLVIVSHCTYIFVQESHNIFVLFLRTMGAVGVDLFFVLSGFLIGGLLLKEIEKNRTKFSHLLIFWKRRWYRTLPNYFLILIVNILLFWFYSKALPYSLGSYFVFLQNFSGPHPVFFTEAWSLSIEEYAYLILPALMFIALSKIKSGHNWVFLWATLFAIFVGLLLKIHFYYNADITTYKDWSAGFRKVVMYRLDAIYFGFLLVFLMRKFADFFKRLKNVFLFSGMFLFIGIHFLIYKLQLQPQTDLEFYVFLYLSSISLSCAMVFPFALDMQRSKSFNSLIYFMSTRSYAMYLVNFSIILLSILQYVSFASFSITLTLQWTLCLLYLFLTVGLSNLIYVYFEKPILRYRDRHF